MTTFMASVKCVAPTSQTSSSPSSIASGLQTLREEKLICTDSAIRIHLYPAHNNSSDNKSEVHTTIFEKATGVLFEK